MTKVQKERLKIEILDCSTYWLKVTNVPVVWSNPQSQGEQKDAARWGETWPSARFCCWLSKVDALELAAIFLVAG
jgi:hypothetical protein